MGFVVPSLMMSDDDALDPEQGKSRFYTYLFTQNIIVTILALPLAILAKEKPETPPS